MPHPVGAWGQQELGTNDNRETDAVPGKRRVLVADDSEDLRVLLRILLEGSGVFEVAGEAANGRQAVEMAATLLPDIVVLDVGMPEMSGLEAVAKVRLVAPEAKVVLWSGFDSSSLSEPAAAQGVDAHIHKAMPPDELVATLVDIADARRP